MPNEIEIKFRIDHVRELTRRLRAAKFRQVTRRTHESNTLYDLPGQPLRKRGELLRLRKYGNGWLLTHKAKSKVTQHKTRVETQTGIDDGAQFEKILLALGYGPSFRYEKFRAEWGDGKGRVVLDQTPIGNFGEIEGPPRWIDATAPDDVLTKPELEWDTAALPEGSYRLRVDASDEIANPPDDVTHHALESGPVRVDNTPPVFKSLAVNGRRLRAEKYRADQ